MTVSPAAGPLTCSGEPASAPTTRPPTMPVIRPAATGTPEAMAMPMHNGSATRNTAMLGNKSACTAEARFSNAIHPQESRQ